MISSATRTATLDLRGQLATRLESERNRPLSTWVNLSLRF